MKGAESNTFWLNINWHSKYKYINRYRYWQKYIRYKGSKFYFVNFCGFHNIVPWEISVYALDVSCITRCPVWCFTFACILCVKNILYVFFILVNFQWLWFSLFPSLYIRVQQLLFFVRVVTSCSMRMMLYTFVRLKEYAYRYGFCVLLRRFDTDCFFFTKTYLYLVHRINKTTSVNNAIRNLET